MQGMRRRAQDKADDQDETAIGKRHDIYYDTKTGTMAAVNYFKGITGPKVITIDGAPAINVVSEKLMAQL